MDLILRETLKRCDLWEAYKLKHNIVEDSMLDLSDAADEAERALLTQLQYNSSNVRYDYQIANDLEPHEDDDEEAFSEWLENYVDERVSSIAYYLQNRFTIEGGEIVLYRKLTAPTDWVEQGGLTSRGLGEYWSWDEHAAEAHWGEFKEGTDEYLMVGSALQRDIDWVTTIVANIDPAYEDEREIKMKDNSTVKLQAVYKVVNRELEEVDIGNLAGKRLPI